MADDPELDAARGRMFDLIAAGIDDLTDEQVEELDALLDQAIAEQGVRGIPVPAGPEDSALWEINKRRAAMGKPALADDLGI